MIFAHRWIAVMLCFLLAGCTVCQDVRRTVFQEPREFSWKGDKARSLEMYRVWADEEWGEICQSDPELRCAEDYAYGFKDGFVDYVYGGGSGDSPPVPPRRYWNADLRTPSGHNGANQWFEGYQLGVTTAREGGYRNQAIVQSSFHYYLANATTAPPYLETLPIPVEQLWPPIERLDLPSETLPPSPILDSEPLPGQTSRKPPKETGEKATSLESTFAKYALPRDEKYSPLRTLDPSPDRATQAECKALPQQSQPRTGQTNRQAAHAAETAPSKESSTPRIGSTVHIIF